MATQTEDALNTSTNRRVSNSNVISLSPPNISLSNFEQIGNVPNAGKLYRSLRHFNYTEIDAIKDIVDNSIDARSDRINVILECRKVEKKGKGNFGEPIERIIIIDNGCAMDKETLVEALKLASETERDIECDLGLYGMGLITASISMGRRLTVYTKEKDGPILIGVHDLDEMQSFEIRIGEADFIGSRYFEHMLEGLKTVKKAGEKESILDVNLESGTIVIVDKLDQMTYSYGQGLERALIREFGQTYRWFAQNQDKSITINQNNIPIIDPIRDHKLRYGTEEEILEIDFGGSTHTIKLYIGELITSGAKDSKVQGISYDTRGFYVVRNFREIIAGTTLNPRGPSSEKIFPEGNHWANNLRIEMMVPAALDDFLKMTFSKNSICLNQSTTAKLRSIVSKYINRCESTNKAESKERKKKKGEEINTKAAQETIDKKKNLLKWPDGVKEVRKSSKKKKAKDKKNDSSDKTKDRIAKKTRVIKTSNGTVEFVFVSIGEHGPVYQPNWNDMGKITVEINVDNPFYNEVLDKCSQEPIDGLLLYFFACAKEELSFNRSDESYNFLCARRTNVGNEVAMLLN